MNDPDVDRIADAATARRYNDAIRKRRQRGTETTGRPYRARVSSRLTVRMDINIRPDLVAAMNAAAKRAGQTRNRWLEELLDDVFRTSGDDAT